MPGAFPSNIFSLSDEFIASSKLAGSAKEAEAEPRADALPTVPEGGAVLSAGGGSATQDSAASPSEAQSDARTTCLTCGIGAACARDGLHVIVLPMPHADKAGCIDSAGSTSPAFQSVAEQRAHFRADWHRCNVRRKVHGRAALSEAEFERSVQDGGELSSISGSDSDDSEDAAATRQASHAGAGSLQRSSQVLFVSGQGHAWLCLLLQLLGYILQLCMQA